MSLDNTDNQIPISKADVNLIVQNMIVIKLDILIYQTSIFKCIYIYYLRTW